MAKRRYKPRGLGRRKKAPGAFELTRLKLLYGLSGIFTLAVTGLLLARPSPLPGTTPVALAAQAQDAFDSAIEIGRNLDRSLWQQIVVERADSLGAATFHFAILPTPSGDQIAISPEWTRQTAFGDRPGELRIVLVAADTGRTPRDEKSVRDLVGRLSDRLKIDPDAIDWR